MAHRLSSPSRVSPLQIPDRTSSKRALEMQRDEIQRDVKRLRKNLKPQASFNSAYWMQHAELALKTKSALELHEKILEETHQEGGHQDNFSETSTAKALREQLRALEADERIFKHQATYLDTASPSKKSRKSLRRSFIELFTTSKLGLGISKTGRGRRETTDQSNFRAGCIEKYNSRNPDPRKDFLWCPVLRAWVLQEHTIAAHLFAYMHGQDMMNAIFGIMESPEIFSPLNGLIVSSVVEARFDKGFLVIVPLVSDYPTQDEIRVWSTTDPKEYKIRILDCNDSEADKVIRPESEETWRDLDGQKLEFRSSFRPRARYLYFHYCIQILRRAWQVDQKAASQLKKEFGKGYWGTIGKFLPREMLQAFIEELGHEYEGLLSGAADDKAMVVDEQNKNLLLGAGSSQVKASRRVEGVIEESSDDSDNIESENEAL